MNDIISRQAAIDAIDNEYPPVAWLDYAVDVIKALPSAQSETDGLDAIRRARRILWEKCKKYVSEHTDDDEITPILHGKYQEEYTGMTNEVQAMSRAIYIMEGMKNRGEI